MYSILRTLYCCYYSNTIQWEWERMAEAAKRKSSRKNNVFLFQSIPPLKLARISYKITEICTSVFRMFCTAEQRYCWIQRIWNTRDTTITSPHTYAHLVRDIISFAASDSTRLPSTQCVRHSYVQRDTKQSSDSVCASVLLLFYFHETDHIVKINVTKLKDINILLHYSVENRYCLVGIRVSHVILSHEMLF